MAWPRAPPEGTTKIHEESRREFTFTNFTNCFCCCSDRVPLPPRALDILLPKSTLFCGFIFRHFSAVAAAPLPLNFFSCLTCVEINQ